MSLGRLFTVLQLVPLSVLLLALPACTTRSEVVFVDRPTVESSSPGPAPGVSAATLSVGLRRFLTAADRGAPVDLMLAGDRLMVLTATDLVEVASLRTRGDLRMIAVGLPGDCSGPCPGRLGDVFSTLRADLAADPLPRVVLAAPPLDGWPTLEVTVPDRRWRVSFDESGKGLFVIELAAGTL